MNTLSLVFLQAAQQPGGGMMSSIIMIVLLIAVFYFFMIRPQQKRQKKIEKFRNELKVGQAIVTIGGIHGVIKSIDNDNNTVVVEVATGVKITFEKVAIALNAAAVQEAQSR